MQVVKLWREDLSKINAKAAESLADPAKYPNLFPNFDLALHAEQYQVKSTAAIHELYVVQGKLYPYGEQEAVRSMFMLLLSGNLLWCQSLP